MRRKQEFSAPWMEDEEDRLWNNSDLDLDEESEDEDEDLDDDFEDGDYEYSASNWREFASSRGDNDDYIDDEEPEWKAAPRSAVWSDDSAGYLEKPSRQHKGRHGRKRFGNEKRRR